MTAALWIVVVIVGLIVAFPVIAVWAIHDPYERPEMRRKI